MLNVFQTNDSGTNKASGHRRQTHRLAFEHLEKRLVLASVQPPLGLVGWWPGDGTTEDIAEGNDGTLISGASFAPGMVDQAFSINRSGSAVQISNSPALNFERNQPFSIDAWVKVTDSGPDIDSALVVFEKGDVTIPLPGPNGSGPAYIVVLRPNFGNIDVAIQGSDFTNRIYFRASLGVSPTDWHLYAMTYDGSSRVSGVKVYVDGRQILPFYTEDTLTTSILSSNPAVIGGDGFAAEPPEQFAAGLIDEVEVFNRVITQPEIQSIFSAGPDGKQKAQPDLTGTFVAVPAEATAGQDVSVSLEIQNLGQTSVNASIDVGFYVSLDDMLSANDNRIASVPVQVNLSTGQTTISASTLTIPNATAAGAYRLIANIDDGGAIDEGNREDNNAVVSGPLTINRLSGREWVRQFPTSRRLADLEDSFEINVRRFIDAVEADGANVRILATLRPAERAYLMHWSWRIARQNYPAANVPDRNGVFIEWWHGDQQTSRAAARQMVRAFGIQNLRVAPALNSNHITGLAIDMAITWQGNLTVVDGNGVTRTIRGGPRNSTNPNLIRVGATFNVIHFINPQRDRNHWSFNGR